ncbi:MAG: hypothetical protein LBJ11_04415 [Oscillospiraceae bacterium]|jgi:hypothetical protein|nr:hypothetical protein [Oscillospiraceae bacterium]
MDRKEETPVADRLRALQEENGPGRRTAPEREWSLSEVDALLAELGIAPEPAPPEPARQTPPRRREQPRQAEPAANAHGQPDSLRLHHLKAGDLWAEEPRTGEFQPVDGAPEDDLPAEEPSLLSPPPEWREREAPRLRLTVQQEEERETAPAGPALSVPVSPEAADLRPVRLSVAGNPVAAAGAEPADLSRTKSLSADLPSRRYPTDANAAIMPVLPQEEPRTQQIPPLPAQTRPDPPSAFAELQAAAAMRGDGLEDIPIERMDEEELPPEPIEKPGLFLRRVDAQLTADLSPVPKIVHAEGLRRRESAGEPFEPALDGQQILPGFDTEADRAKISEEELEEQVRSRRADKAGNFTVMHSLADQLAASGETGDGAQPPPLEEEAFDGEPDYTGVSNRDNIRALLQRRLTRHGAGSVLLALLTAGAALLAALPSLIALLTAEPARPLFSEIHWMEPLLQILLLTAGLLLCLPALANGVRGFGRRRPNADSILLLAAGMVTVQTVLCFFQYDSIRAPLSYAPLLLFAAFLRELAARMRTRQQYEAFRFAAYQAAGELHELRRADAGAGGASLNAQIPYQRADTLYAAPLGFPSHFLRQTDRRDEVDRFGPLTLLLGMGMALLAGIAAGISSQSVGAGAAAAAAALCLCVPAPGLASLYFALRAAGKTLNQNGVALLHSDAVRARSATQAVILDAPDLFRSGGRLHGMKGYCQVRTDDVLLYAAAIAFAAGGALGDAFRGVVEGDRSVLPPVHKLIYEDKMGLSCLIHNQKVLFGNRRLLENHNVSVLLLEQDERKYEHTGRRVIYLAVDKRLAAFFVVSYQVDPDIASYLRRLERLDIGIAFCNSDPCITRESISREFELHSDSIRMLRGAATRVYREQRKAPTSSAPADILLDGSPYAFLRGVTACANLWRGIRRLRPLHVVGALLGCLLLFAAALTHHLTLANSAGLILWEAVWTAATMLACAPKEI